MRAEGQSIETFISERLIEDLQAIRTAGHESLRPFGQARLLRSVEASWAILDDHDHDREGYQWTHCWGYDPAAGLHCAALCALASIYADHIGYNPAWSACE